MPAAEQLSNQPALSVVIPTRNRADVVCRAVQSVLLATRPDLEAIVVDDGSSDDTPARLRMIGDSRLRFHQIESSGNANRARNVGARLARSALIAFLDSDDTFGPHRVDRLIDFFERRQGVDCLVDGYVDISRRNIKSIHRLPRPSPDRPEIRRMVVAHLIPLTNSAITVRRAAFEAVGGYDENMPRHQDRELLLRLTQAHSIWLGDDIDVQKYRLKKSLSHQSDGYIAGMDALAARCPDYSLPENTQLFRYLIVRGIVKAIANGRWAIAVQELRDWGRAQHLPKEYLSCFYSYLIGHKQRRRAQRRD